MPDQIDPVAREMAMSTKMIIQAHLKECHEDKKEFRDLFEKMNSRIDSIFKKISDNMVNMTNARTKIILSIAGGVILIQLSALAWLINLVYEVIKTS